MLSFQNGHITLRHLIDSCRAQSSFSSQILHAQLTTLHRLYHLSLSPRIPAVVSLTLPTGMQAVVSLTLSTEMQEGKHTVCPRKSGFHVECQD